MTQFFVTADCISGDRISLLPEDALHAARVLRMKPGDSAIICDNGGMRHQCLISLVEKSNVEAKIISSCEYSNAPTAQVTVYAGISKGDRFDYLIQKCVECGAHRIVPFVSKYCIARPDERDYEKKHLRFSRIALEASKQSQRSSPATVGEIVSIDQALACGSKSACGLFLYEKENHLSLSSVLGSADKRGDFAIITGPEGGFSVEEAQNATALSLHCVSIGPRILRCETAPMAALCAIMYHTGNFDIGE